MNKKAKGIIVDIVLLLGFSFLILVLSGTVYEFFPKLSAFVLIFEIICSIIIFVSHKITIKKESVYIF